jgi:hypothetical protein
LKEHPDFNREGKWVKSPSYKKKKASNVSKGVGEEHPKLKWNAGGGVLADAKRKGEYCGASVALMIQGVVASMESPDRVPLTSMEYASRKEIVSQEEVCLVCWLSRQEYHTTVMMQASI